MPQNPIQTASRNWRPETRYALAVAIYLIALLVRVLILPIDAGWGYLTFYPAMVICFYYCGVGPGLLMAGLSAVTGFYAFLPPYFSFYKSLTGGIVLITFLIAVAMIAWAVRELQVAIALAAERESALKASEAKLRLTEELYSTILQDQTELISRFGPDRRFTFVNDAFCRLFGKSREELIGQVWTPIPHPDDVPHINKELSKLSPQNPIVEIENRVTTGDGSVRWCRFVNRGFFDDKGVLTGLQAVGRDITERHEVQEQLLISNSRFNDLAARVPAGLFTIRARSGGEVGFDYVSDKLLEMVGATREMALANPEVIFGSIHPLDRPALDEANRVAVQTQKPFLWEGRCQIHGDFRWVRVESNPNLLPNGDSLWNGIITDVTERKVLEEEITQLAFHDPLTSLPNRRLLTDRFNVAMAANLRNARFGALLLIDLDNFKPLNDSHGHGAGDSLLIEVARRLIACVRSMDTVARVGGDEFVVMVTDLDADPSRSKELAMAVAEKIRLALAAPYEISVRASTGEDRDVTHHCSASIGVTIFPEGDLPDEELFHRADLAMYAAKAQGRNRANYYDPESPKPSPAGQPNH